MCVPIGRFCGGVKVSPAATKLSAGSVHPIALVEGLAVAVNVGIGSPIHIDIVLVETTSGF